MWRGRASKCNEGCKLQIWAAKVKTEDKPIRAKTGKARPGLPRLQRGRGEALEGGPDPSSPLENPPACRAVLTEKNCRGHRKKEMSVYSPICVKPKEYVYTEAKKSERNLGIYAKSTKTKENDYILKFSIFQNFAFSSQRFFPVAGDPLGQGVSSVEPPEVSSPYGKPLQSEKFQIE